MKKKFWIIGLVLILIIIVSFFLWQKKSKTIYNQASSGKPTLALAPTTDTQSLNSTFGVNIELNTDGETVGGVDLVLHYDPLVFNIQDDNPNAAGNQIAQGSIANFEISTANEVNSTTGTITCKVSTASNYFIGEGVVATIHFKGKKVASNSPVTFNYIQGDNSLTKVIDTHGLNILSGVSDGSYTLTEQLINAPTLSLTIDGMTSISKRVGESAVLNWQSTNANTCNASHGWSGDRPQSGQETITISEATSYTLTCIGSGGSVQDNVSVVISAVNASGSSNGSQDEVTAENSETASESPSASTTSSNEIAPPIESKFSSLPQNILPRNIAGSTTEIKPASSMKSWVLWLVYAIIPLVLSGLIVYLSQLIRKNTHQNNQSNETITDKSQPQPTIIKATNSKDISSNIKSKQPKIMR